MNEGFGIRVVKTVFLANGHFAGVPRAIFVIFVDLRVCGANSLVVVVECKQYQTSRQFRQNHLFSARDKKRPFSRTTVSTTLMVRISTGKAIQ